MPEPKQKLTHERLRDLAERALAALAEYEGYRIVTMKTIFDPKDGSWSSEVSMSAAKPRRSKN